MQIKNQYLDKYEIKKPDYRYIERPSVKFADVMYKPARYVQTGAHAWASVDRSGCDADRQSVKLMFTGDITCFEKQILAAQTGDDTYDFEYVFKEMQPIYKQADLVVGNLETMLFANAPYRSEKFVNESNYHCNAPSEFVDAVRLSGMDVVTNANNHDLDTGAVGLGETLDMIDKMGLIHTGTFKEEGKRYEIIDVKGIKIGLVAMACEHNKKDQNLTPEGRDFLLHDYSPEKAEALLNAAYADGADLVIICIHWGKENIQEPNEDELRMARELAEMGYDCIIGSHPHVLQPFTILHTEKKEVPVFYSMGNYVAHNLNNPKARSIVACIDIVKDKGKFSIQCSYIPIFVGEKYKGGSFVVLPIKENTPDKESQWKLEKIMETMGKEIGLNKDVVYEDHPDEVRYRESRLEKLKNISPVLPVMILGSLGIGNSKEDGKKGIASKIQKSADYDDGYFIYKIFADHAEVVGLSQDASNMSYTIPESILNIPVTILREGAFEGNTWMKKINFRKNLPSIPKRVMKGCTNLEGFQCGRNSRVIEEEAFANCTKMTFAAFNAFVERIEDRAFADCCNLMSAKVHPNVSYISDSAFEGCPDLTFYCEEGSYAWQYAKRMGIPCVHMKLSRGGETESAPAVSESKEGPVVGQVTGFKAVNTDEGIELKWQPLENISKYKLYRKSANEKVFKRIRTTVRNSYLDTDVSEGGVYEYKMRAYLEAGEIINGEFSEVVGIVYHSSQNELLLARENDREVQITVSCVGDVTLGSNQKQLYEGSFHESYDKFGESYFFKNVKKIFEKSDYTLANFEGVLTESEERRKKRFNHKGRPIYAQILKNAHIDCVSLSNNHIIDYRKVGAMDTMKYIRESGVDYAICGDYGVRYSLIKTKENIGVGTVSINALDGDERNEQWLINGVTELRKKGATIVIAAIHWGTDKSHEITESQERLGHWCIDHGYDLVVGCHAHVLQGIEKYKGRYIVYNMGNFCYGGHHNPVDKETIIYQQTFMIRKGEIKASAVRIIPCMISEHEEYNDYCPVVARDSQEEQIISHMNEYSAAYNLSFDSQGKENSQEKTEGIAGKLTGLFKGFKK